MASSQCPKCANRFFEIATNSPRGGNFKLGFVQCTQCGSVVGTMDYYNIGKLINDLEKKIDNKGRTSVSNSTISKNLHTINQNVASLFQLIKSTNSKLEKIEAQLKGDKEL